MLTPTVGHMRPDSDRAAWWQSIFGSLDVPLISPTPYKSATAGGAPEYYYQLDIKRLTPEQLDKICRFMSEQFGEPLEVVRAGVEGEHGVPVRVSEIGGVSFDARMVV